MDAAGAADVDEEGDVAVDGLLIEVVERAVGSHATAPVAIGGTVIPVEDPTPFVDGGGRVLIAGVEYDYLSVTDDGDTGTLTLADPLTAAVLEFDTITTVTGIEETTEVYAIVSLDDDELEDTEQGRVEVLLGFDQIASFPVGVYDPPVPVVLSDDYDEVLDVPGSLPLIDASRIDLDTLPDPTAPDGLPPASSPTPTVLGGIGILHVRWAPVENHDAVTYEVHVSATSGFTPSAATKALESGGGSATIRTLPNGDPLLYGTTYYVKIVAEDVDGPAPASAEASGQMFQVTGPDVSAEYVYAGTINADRIIGAAIDADGIVSRTVRTALAGARTEIDETGIRVINSAGQVMIDLAPGAPFFRGAAVLEDVTTTGTLRIGGTDNEVMQGVTIRFADKTKAPNQAPAYYTARIVVPVAEATRVGLASLDVTFWVTTKPRIGGGYHLVKVNKSNGTETVIYSGAEASVDPPAGVFVTPGLHIYVVQVFGGNGGRLYVTQHDIATGAWTGPSGGSFNFPLSSIPGTPTANEAAAAGFGYDTANSRVLMAWVDASAGDTMKVSSWTLAGASHTTLTLDRTRPDGQTPVGIHRTTEFTGASYVIQTGGNIEVFFADTGSERIDLEWGAGGAGHGFAHDGTNYWSLQTAQLLKHEADKGVVDWWVAYEWYDSVAPTNRTNLGKATKIPITNNNRRMIVTLTSAPIPGTGGSDQPNQARFYVAVSDSAAQPAVGSFWLQGAANVPGRVSEQIILPATSGTAATATNGFVAGGVGTAAKLTSEATDGAGPLWSLDGSGVWRLGDLNGSGSGDTWHTITPLNSYTAGAQTPKYRIDPTGRVELRGHIDSSAATNGAVLFTLPVGYRPDQTINLACVTFPATSSTGRIIIGSSGNVELWDGMGAPTDFRLDGVSFSTR